MSQARIHFSSYLQGCVHLTAAGLWSVGRWRLGGGISRAHGTGASAEKLVYREINCNSRMQNSSQPVLATFGTITRKGFDRWGLIGRGSRESCHVP